MFVLTWVSFIYVVVPQNPRAREAGKYYGKGAYGKHRNSSREQNSRTAEVGTAMPSTTTGPSPAEATTTAASLTATNKVQYQTRCETRIYGVYIIANKGLPGFVSPISSSYICSVSQECSSCRE